METREATPNSAPGTQTTVYLQNGKVRMDVTDFPDGEAGPWVMVRTVYGGYPNAAVCVHLPRNEAALGIMADALEGAVDHLRGIVEDLRTSCKACETPEGLGHRHPWREVGRPCDDPECDALQCKALRDAEALGEAASERLTDDVMGRGYVTNPLTGVSG
jgi:hypothetical protein